MKFETLTIQSVKSISQRALLWQWSELTAGRRFPPFSDFHVDGRTIDPKSILIWTVERDAGDRRFRSRYHSGRLAEAFHGNWIGKTMEEMAPASLKQYALATANECVDSGCAVFSILSTLDRAGHRIDCERLLLPFGKSADVEQMVATMELISIKGDFQRRTILNEYRMASTIEVAGRIAAGFKKPAVSTPGQVIERGTAGVSLLAPT